MKRMFTLFAVLFAAYMQAQSTGLQVQNNTECYFAVYATAAGDTACDSTCSTIKYCIPPGGNIVINPCSSDSSKVWDYVCISPTEGPSCKPCLFFPYICMGNPYNNNCLGLPTAIYDERACGACRTYSASFTSATSVVIN